MPRPPTPGQRAAQITFVLSDMEDYAAKRLGLQRSALYHYLQIHDWLREFHPSWLAPRPKGFIPELSDASALMWIERRLRDGRLSDSSRKELEAMRKKALAGALTAQEFRVLRDSLRPSTHADAAASDARSIPLAPPRRRAVARRGRSGLAYRRCSRDDDRANRDRPSLRHRLICGNPRQSRFSQSVRMDWGAGSELGTRSRWVAVGTECNRRDEQVVGDPFDCSPVVADGLDVLHLGDYQGEHCMPPCV
jgi:hypothetical protein